MLKGTNVYQFVPICIKMLLLKGTNIAYEEPPATAALTLDDVQVQINITIKYCHQHVTIIMLVIKSALALIVLGVLVSHIIFAFELFTRKFIMVK